MPWTIGATPAVRFAATAILLAVACHLKTSPNESRCRDDGLGSGTAGWFDPNVHDVITHRKR